MNITRYHGRDQTCYSGEVVPLSIPDVPKHIRTLNSDVKANLLQTIFSEHIGIANDYQHFSITRYTCYMQRLSSPPPCCRQTTCRSHGSRLFRSRNPVDGKTMGCSNKNMFEHMFTRNISRNKKKSVTKQSDGNSNSCESS